MSRTVEVHTYLWDDLSDPETVEATQTITVGLNGQWKELDLNDANATAVSKALQRYMDAGHDPGGTTPPSRRRRHSGDPSARQKSIEWHAGLREYARAQGHTVTAGGYVGTVVRRDYEKIAGPKPYWWGSGT